MILKVRVDAWDSWGFRAFLGLAWWRFGALDRVCVGRFGVSGLQWFAAKPTARPAFVPGAEAAL